MRIARTLGLLAAALALSAAPVLADSIGEIEPLVAEGTKWFKESGNTDLPSGDRNAARVKAWKSLWPAREMLDRLCEKNPGDEEALNRKYGEIRSMIYWLRKESPMGLLEGSGVGPTKSTEAGEDDAAPVAPAPPAPKPPTPAPGAPPAPAPAAPPPAAPAIPTLDTLFAAAEAYEKEHRFDTPGIHGRWLRVVATYPDSPDPRVRTAAEKTGAAEAKLKDAYRLLRNEDPDALKGATSVKLRGFVIVVSRDLVSPDSALRTRAARTLGLIGHPEGAYELKKALEKEAEDEPADAMADAMFRIGGRKGADALADFKAHPKHAGRALEALVTLARRNSVDRRIAAKEMARFMGARDESLFEKMLATQKSLGQDGIHGLAACTEHNTTASRLIAVCQAMGGSKEPAVARVLAKYFQPGRGPQDAAIRDAAMNAVREMFKKENCGEAVIPHLFVGLRNGATRGYTTMLLQELTGQKFDVKAWNQWSAWWRQRHPEWKEGD
jgi:hypothetical protein